MANLKFLIAVFLPSWQNKPMEHVRFKMLRTAVLALSASTLALSGAHAQSFADAFGGFKQSGGAPISIDAKSLDIESKAGFATFSGGVRVVQNATVFTTNKLVVTYTGESLTEPSSIKTLKANGRLQVRTGAKSAEADAGVFDMQANKVVLTGNVKVQDGANSAQGCRLTVNLKSGDANLESANCGGQSSSQPNRVTLTLTPKN